MEAAALARAQTEARRLKSNAAVRQAENNAAKAAGTAAGAAAGATVVGMIVR